MGVNGGGGAVYVEARHREAPLSMIVHCASLDLAEAAAIKLLDAGHEVQVKAQGLHGAPSLSGAMEMRAVWDVQFEAMDFVEEEE